MIKFQLNRLRLWLRQFATKDATMENNQENTVAVKPEPQAAPALYTEEQLMARLKFFIGICLALTLTGIVFVVLYSIIFVTQPLNAISPIDSKFFELIIPIATFLTGTLSGIMLAGNNKDAQMEAIKAANRPSGPSPTPPAGLSRPAVAPSPVRPAMPARPAPIARPMDDDEDDVPLVGRRPVDD
jgi:hypothetical protein